MKNVARNISLIRFVSKRTQSKFGDLIGATKDQIASWEVGRATPNTLYLQKIAELVRLPVDAIHNNSLKEPELKIVFRQEPKTPDPLYTDPTHSDRRININPPAESNQLLAEKDKTIKRLEEDKAWLKSQLEKFMGTNGLQKS